MRIAILTFHRAYNCGAALQAWALKTVLERMGHIVEFPVCNHVGERGRWRHAWINHDKRGLALLQSLVGRTLSNLLSFPSEDVLRARYSRFRLNNLPERFCAISELPELYDLIVVGSDQVWSAKHTLSDAPLFFAENVSPLIRKIAYAASYGDEPLGELAVKRVADCLKHFSEISVREPLARDQLQEFSSTQIDVTLDPTLLLIDKDYDVISCRASLVRRPYLFMYTLSTAPFFVNTAKRLSERLGVKCVIAPCYQYSRFGALSGLTYSISPDRLVALSRGAKYIVAGSFHGTAMGLIFKKPFISLRSQVDSYESRPAALLKSIGCLERLVTPNTTLDNMQRILSSDISAQTLELLAKRRLESLEWLKRGVEN